ncbi:hypothetical protein [Streptomyces sp. MT206]|uniref:hypothetical protein n=1 Tax=Streptomyces sp. MT206 TaxID=3031407 RepID=UPI002FCC5E4A
MEHEQVFAAVVNRAPVRIVRLEWARGLEGIAMGYNDLYDTIRVGFVDGEGRYAGEKTTAPRSHVELIKASEAPAEGRGLSVTA